MKSDIEVYSQMVDNFAWYNKGDIFKLAKLAKKLNRNYTQDIAERKLALSSGGDCLGKSNT